MDLTTLYILCITSATFCKTDFKVSKSREQSRRSHMETIILDPTSYECLCDKPNYRDIDDYILRSQEQIKWNGTCRYHFSDNDHRSSKDSDDSILMTLNGQLAHYETLIITNQHSSFIWNHDNSADGSCIILEGIHTVEYITTDGFSNDWQLISISVDCEEDDMEDCEQQCRIDQCQRVPNSQCRSRGCIDDDNKCDGIAQCPLKEDEQNCGITTNSTLKPSTTTTTSIPTLPSTTTQRPIIPSHVDLISIDPLSLECLCEVLNYRDFGEYMIKIDENIQWTGKCMYYFADDDYRRNQKDSDDSTLLTLNGRLNTYENLTITNWPYQFTWNHESPSNDACLTLRGSYQIEYSTSKQTSHNWYLLLTPIECEDYNTRDGCDQLCDISHCINSPSSNCRLRGCIDDDNKCDGLAQCPLKEDEQNCGTGSHKGNGLAIGISVFLIIIAVIVGAILAVKVVKSRSKTNAHDEQNTLNELNNDFTDRELPDSDRFGGNNISYLKIIGKKEDSYKEQHENIYEVPS